MSQLYSETADRVQTVKANPGNKWVRSLAEKNCQFVAAGSFPEYKCCPCIQARRQGLLSHLGHCQEGSKAEGAAAVRTSRSSWGLGLSCPPSLALIARGATAGKDCHVALASHCKTSWSLQLSEILVPWAVSHRKMWKWILQGEKN